MQQKHEEKQQFQAHLEEAAEAHHVEHIAQKARKMAKAKMREEAKKRRIIEEKKKRKRLEYLQQLQNKMLAKVAVLLEDTRGFQVMGIKCKKITTIFSEDETRQ